MSPPGKLDDLSPAELKALVIRLMGDITELQRVIEDKRAEIARLKGLKGRPRLKPSKPSGMEEASLSKPTHPRRRGRGHQTRVAVEKEMIPVAVPAGSRFKGYQDYVVQELEIWPRVLADPRRAHGGSTAAGRHLRTFRPEFATLCAGAIPSGAGNGAAAGGTAARLRAGGIQASAGTAADRPAGALSR